MADPHLDPLQHALSQIQGAGLLVDTLQLDGKIHRVDTEGAKRGKKAGWYSCEELRLDNGKVVIVGAYGQWVGRDPNTTNLKVSGKLNTAERDRFKEQQRLANERAKAEELVRHAEAAKRASETFPNLWPQGTSGYLKRKKVKAHGVRFGKEGRFAIPMRNVAGKLVGLQWISEDGGKKFLTGTEKLGAWHMIGDVLEDSRIVLAEGYATAASVHEATGWPVAVCFDAGNLLRVGQALRSLYPALPFLVAADDDHEAVNKATGEPYNAGREAGDKAAQTLKCPVAYPVFVDATGKSDFNDLHCEQSLKIVSEQIKAAVNRALPAGASTDDSEAWHKQLVWGESELKAMVHNVMLVLQHHPAWLAEDGKSIFAWDAFQKRLVMRAKPPYGGRPGRLNDGDETEIAAWFGRRDTYRISVPTLMAREASIAVGMRQSFHPVRDYLKKVKWDGTKRIDTFFSKYCNVEQTDFSAAFGRCFFLSCVARVRRPGCKADLMLVLEGEQGARKSTLAQVLCGKDWFADLGTAASDKDFYQIIQGRWVVEMSELASFARSEASHIKRAISTNTDTFRPSYGRNVESYPRECIFFGTVNNNTWQRDESGGRRYMPLWVKDIDIEGVQAIRDQLWAEAVKRYEAGENWHELPESATDEQDSRYEDDIWTGRIMRWLDGKLPGNCYALEHPSVIEVTSATELLSRVLDIEVKKQDKHLQMRVGSIMRRIGWSRKQVRLGSAKVWKYVRPKADSEAQAGEKQ